MAAWEVAQTISDVISADLRKRQERGRAGELGNATQGLTGSCGRRGEAQGASGRTLREGYSAQDRRTSQEVRVEVVGDSGHDLGGCAASRYAVTHLYSVPKILPQYHLSSFPPSLSLKSLSAEEVVGDVPQALEVVQVAGPHPTLRFESSTSPPGGSSTSRARVAGSSSSHFFPFDPLGSP